MKRQPIRYSERRQYLRKKYFGYETELYHRGVKGQKWGVRNGPPYPLDRSGGRDPRVNALVNRRGSQKAAGYVDREMISEMTTYYAVAAAVSVGTELLLYSLNRRKALKEFDSLKDNRTIKSFDSCPKLSRKMPASESANVTNPDYPAEGTTQNCTYCTTAMALREKGYDVVAGKRNKGAWSDLLFKKAFNSPTVKVKRKTANEGGNWLNRDSNGLLKELASHGEGAYGNLGIDWKLGGGHSIFWKVENGRTHIYDGQTGEEYTKSNASWRKVAMNINTRGLDYNRLDNCEPTEYALAFVEPRKK